MSGGAEEVRATVATDPVGACTKILGTELRRLGNEYLARCFRPEHHRNADAHPSLRINPDKVLWCCDPCDIGGDVFDLFAMKHGLDVQADFPRVVARLAELLGINGSDPQTRAARRRDLRSQKKPEKQGSEPADVEDLGPPTEGQIRALIFSRRITKADTLERIGARHVRYKGRDYLGFRTLAGSWKLWAIDASGYPAFNDKGKLLRLNIGQVSLVVPRELLESNGSGLVRLYDVEGESDLLALVDAGCSAGVATTGGAMSLEGHAAHADFLLRLHPVEVAAFRDLDVAGRRGAGAVADWYRRIGIPVRVPMLPEELGDGGDVRDFLLGRPAKNGDPAQAPLGTFADLEKLADAAELLEPVEDVEAEKTERGSRVGLEFTRVGSLLAEPEEAVEWIVEGLLARGGFSVLVAKPKVGKSTLARCIALAVARGEPVLGRKAECGPVLYLALEESKRQVKAHFRALGATEADDVHVFAGAAPVGVLLELRAAVLEYRPVLVIIDTLFRLTRVKDTNAYAEVTAALDPLLALARELGAHVMVLHHSPKGDARHAVEAALGSIAITGSVDIVMALRKNDRFRTIITEQREGEGFPDEVTLDFDPDTRRVSVGPSRKDADEQEAATAILGYLAAQSEPIKEETINNAVEGRTVAKRPALRWLVEQGKVVRTGKGKKGDPYHYAVGGDGPEEDSCSLVPNICREQENKNPKSSEKHRGSAENSCSHDFADSEKDGNENPDVGNEDPSEPEEWL